MQDDDERRRKIHEADDALLDTIWAVVKVALALGFWLFALAWLATWLYDLWQSGVLTPPSWR